MTFERLPDATFTRDQIAIALTHGLLGGGHLGIAFHSVKEGPQLTHLAWHHRLCVDNIPNDLRGCWVSKTVVLPPAASKAVVAVVRGLSKKRPQINYGLNAIAAKGSFAPNGSYRPPKGSDGLTCATFVVEVFRAAGIPLVSYESWEDRPENRSWGERVCQELQNRNVPQEHIDSVRKNISGIRVRPCEAVAAAALPPRGRPANYLAVQDGAVEAEKALRDICPLQNQ
jgi:hypothetical protein